MTRGNLIFSTLVLLSLLMPDSSGAAQSQNNPSAGDSRKTFTISGTVGLPGVKFKSLPGDPVSDDQGRFSIEVPNDLNGYVMPIKEGYAFAPPFVAFGPTSRIDTMHFTPRALTFTISGQAGMPGVVMQGLPGNPVTNPQGGYGAQVDYGWSGTVTPTKPGYRFEPPARQYTQVVRNQEKEDYTGRLFTFTISGNVGVPGVAMRGFPGDVVSDEGGRYSVDLMYGWSGEITPNKPGYGFNPASRSYLKVTDSLAQQDYVPRALTHMISGSAGAPGVMMRGLPREPVTDPQGNYRAQVEYGWSGVISPHKEGFEFTPSERTYERVTSNLSNENYAARERMVTISNVIAFHNEPIQGVTVTAEPGGYQAVSDSRGRYTLKVPHGWSGGLTLSKPGFEFSGQIEYQAVTADIIDRKSSPTPEDWPPLPTAVPASKGDVLVIPTAEVVPERVAELTEDLRVMLQILREKLNEPRMILGVLRDYGGFFGEDRKVQAIYLQGTAAVFMIEMDFPYSFLAQRPDTNEVPQEAGDPIWQRARQKLYAPAGSRAYGQPGQTQEMTFEQFKEELLRSLKHAANLRHIDPNEQVILTLVAQNERANRTLLEAELLEEYNRINGFSVAATTVLTMQAKKVDINAFARGDLDFEQFQQRVKTFAY